MQLSIRSPNDSPLFRILLSLPLAWLIVFLLFYFMQSLIDTGLALQKPLSVVKIVDSTMPSFPDEPVLIIEEPEIIELPTPSDPAPPKVFTTGDNPSLYIQDTAPNIDPTPAIEEFSVGASDGNYLPLVSIAPQYPSRELRNGVEGWCLVEFTVDERGNVLEESIVVVDAEPASVFNRASIRAASRFKFQPRIENGVGVAVHRVPYLFRFQIEGN